MSWASKTLLAVTLASGLSLTERVADPFERFEQGYTLEGPTTRSEVFYVSSNWYDENGVKHDDRVGDLLLVTTAAGLGAFAIQRARLEQSAMPSAEITS